MQMRPPLQIQSILKAMTDVVLPALDPDNKLAQEQARLIMGTLGLMARQLPLQFRFDCDELARMIGFSQQLQELARGGAGTAGAVAALGNDVTNAARVLEAAKAGPPDVEQCVRELRAATGSVVSKVYEDGQPASQHQVSKAVLTMSKEQLLRERAWLISQGWEPDPKSIPAIETLLGLGESLIRLKT